MLHSELLSISVAIKQETSLARVSLRLLYTRGVKAGRGAVEEQTYILRYRRRWLLPQSLSHESFVVSMTWTFRPWTWLESSSATSNMQQSCTHMPWTRLKAHGFSILWLKNTFPIKQKLKSTPCSRCTEEGKLRFQIFISSTTFLKRFKCTINDISITINQQNACLVFIFK